MCLRLRLRILAVLQLCLMGVMVREAQTAPIVFNNVNGVYTAGNAMTNYIQAEDFSFVKDTVITGITFWAGARDEQDYLGSITWMILNDCCDPPDQPGSLYDPGTIVASGSVSVQGKGHLWRRRFSFSVGDILLEGGTTYWLALHNGPLTEGGCGDEPWFWWSATPPNNTLAAEESQFACHLGTWEADWLENGFEHAFRLRGHTVPEPAVSLLFGAGLTATSVIRSRRRRRSQPSR